MSLSDIGQRDALATSVTPLAESHDRRRANNGLGARLWRDVRQRWDIRAALLWIVTITILSVAAPWLPFAPANQQDLAARLQPPLWLAGADVAHPLGTDQLGRDVLSRVTAGAQVSLLIGISAVLLAGTIGVLVGLYSGYASGRLPTLLSRIADVQIAFPYIVFGIAVVAVVGTGVGTLILVLGIYGWVVYARVVRSETLSVRQREFIEAARACGATEAAIIFRHILPNVSSSVVVIATVSVGQMIVAESSLSFLGLGVPPTTASWGSMLADSRDHLQGAWWISVMPGLALVITVLAINMLADRVRDALDPRLQIQARKDASE